MANIYPYKTDKVTCEDAAEFFKGRSLKRMYGKYSVGGVNDKIVLEFEGTDKYLVIPAAGVELVDPREV